VARLELATVYHILMNGVFSGSAARICHCLPTH
jgi:hypothetical protein